MDFSIVGKKSATSAVVDTPTESDVKTLSKVSPDESGRKKLLSILEKVEGAAVISALIISRVCL